MVAYFDSIARDDTQSAGFGLQIVGSRALIDLNCDKLPLAYLVTRQSISTDEVGSTVDSNYIGRTGQAGTDS